VQVLQSCPCSWCYPYQGAITAHKSNLWVAKCTADEAVLQPVLDEMRVIDAQSKAAAVTAAAAAAAAAAAPARQKHNSKCEHLLGTCKEAADACGVQGSSEQTWLSAPRSWCRGRAHAPASKVFCDNEECQGSDAEDSSSSDEDTAPAMRSR